MKMLFRSLTMMCIAFILISGQVHAQNTDPLPISHVMEGFNYERQGWNNCGPATLTIALSYFGYQDNQLRAANYLKPNYEDKNVSPWQMVNFVNTQVPEIPVYSLIRYGGTLDTLRTLVANNFPVIIEEGYDPENDPQGWMGHYLLIIGYDDTRQIFITHDSYNNGALREYSYEHINEFWQHFNYTYMPIYLQTDETELLSLLGNNADLRTNITNAFNRALQEANVNADDAFAFHNMGSNLVMLARDFEMTEQWERAVIAFDQARTLILPWRTLWYQFGMYEAYNAVGDYETTLSLANITLDDGGGQYVEETYYYAGIAREALGEFQRALNNYNAVISFNPNFTPAIEAREALLADMD